VEYPDGNNASAYTITNSVTSIGDSAFEYCKLASISIPGNVTNIGNYSFESCDYLTAVTIPEGVVSIGNEAFAQCNGLTGILLPASVTNLGQIPFANCLNMTAITVAAGNPDFSSANGVLYNKTATVLIEYPSGVPGSFTVPNGVQDLGSQAFEQCPVTTVAIPPSVTNIESLVFFDCVDLGSVSMTEGLEDIGVAAFENCSALTSCILPASLTSIGNSAFSECTSLATVVVPSAVQSLSGYAFAYCSSLTAAYFEGNAPPNGSMVFYNDSSTTVYYLPGATGWGSTFGTAPTKALTGIAITALPSSGYVPLPVSFTAAATDGETNPVVNWNWQFGDGSSSAVRNPAHTYEASGVYTAAVVETNVAGLPLAGAAVTITVTIMPVYSGLVENGGFETGDFTGWDLFGGDPPDNFVTNSINGVSAYAGNDFAVLGSFGTNLTYLSQSLTTTAGGTYALSLWLDSPDGLGPNEFLVTWNGTTLFNQTNIPALGWTNLQFTVSATGTSTVLEFGFRDDPSFLGLDDISVYPLQPAITGLSLEGANLVIDGTHGLSGNTYIVLTSTNLASPLNQWTPAVTNLLGASGNFSITVTNTVSAGTPHRFYILQTE
jgi:PKD repeat protein